MHSEHKINDLFETTRGLLFHSYIKINTVLIRPNLMESRPQLNPEVTFGVYSGFRADPELTPSRPNVNARVDRHKA